MAPREEEEGDDDLLDNEPPVIEPYTVLGIAKTATAEEIKSAYRKAALRHHPGILSHSFSWSRSNLLSSYYSFVITGY